MQCISTVCAFLERSPNAAVGLSLIAFPFAALAKAADQGIRFDQLAPVDAESDTFVKLVQLMRQPGPLAITLCHVASAAQFEDLIEIILKVFSNRKVIARFLKAVIEMEVSVTGGSRARRSSAISNKADRNLYEQITSRLSSEATASRLAS